ncbi:MAG: CheR family methyltransferase, partial [Kangiellaceae bacterium]|nr:CheR family methyltransferase [Kangiellaceae bacterium]
QSLSLVQQHLQQTIDRAVEQQQTQPINSQVWSVGCSTGEEVFSLAMLLSELDISELQRQKRDFYFGVTGVDISFPALAQAREATFHRRRLGNVPTANLMKYFDRLPDDYYQINAGLRQRTCFIQGNIKELASMPRHSYDVIYCQNVLIYFQPDQRAAVVDQFIERLAPGGLLVLGPGELNNLDNSLVERVSSKNCQAYVRLATE